MNRNTIAFWLVIVLLVTTCGGKKEEGTISSNDAPVLQSVTLLPLNPNVRSEITARILASDKDGDPITYLVKWFVNEDEIGEGMSFTYPDIKKGDKIFAEVTPYDGKTYGKTMRSGEVTIGGMAPRIVSVSVMPEMVYVTTPQITLNALFEDADQDEIDLVVHWLVNDEVLPNTSNVLQLSSLGLKKNDVITGAAFADDGDDRSEPFPFEITIANSPPAFKMKIDSVKCATDSVYYALPIFDPDGDPLSFELLDAPSGIMIDKENGVIYGTAGQTEVFEVFVRATDAEGAYLDAQFTLAAK
ncbi:MAG: putative Ig domain-containing protein [candidate division WOR-3 bacterium]|nr:putative Ig domain-containing protein [candidate division WOR-3 bacterium]